MERKLKTAWTVAGILAVLLVIVTVMAVRAGAFTLDGADLARQSEKLDDACTTEEGVDSPACRDALDDLANLLERFSNKLEREQRNASSTPKIEATVSTTTAL